MSKKETKSFWKQAKANYDEVLTWPKWMRCIVISAKTASTGQFNGPDIKDR